MSLFFPRLFPHGLAAQKKTGKKVAFPGFELGVTVNSRAKTSATANKKGTNDD